MFGKALPVCKASSEQSKGDHGGACYQNQRGNMKHQSLNDAWRLYQADDTEPIPASVPGCVHGDLLAAGKIPDPFYRDNELELLWIGETDWVYQREFDAPDDFLACQRVLLRCHGLDTLVLFHITDLDFYSGR